MKNIEWRRWTVLLAAVAFLTAQGCRERGDYQPPGYVPPPPPPPAQAQAQTEPSGPAPLQKIDLAKMEPRLKDPKDAKDPSVDLKSVIAGIEDNELVIRFETYGEPFKDQNTWFLAWLSTRESPLLYKVQVSHEGHYVLGGVFENDKVETEDAVVSNTVKAEGNVVEARFPWSKLPKELQMRDLTLSEPSIISSKDENSKPEVLDIIDGKDQVRN